MFGAGSAGFIGKRLKMFEVNNVMLISDVGNKNAGHPERIVEILRSEGYQVTEYYDVLHDPTDASGDAIGQIARDAGVELVIGVGGGSVIDTAKMVGVSVKTGELISEFFTSKFFTTPDKLRPVPSIPVVLLPTTAGSGSEMSSVAVVSHAEDAVKDSILNSGALAIVDPELMATAPPFITGPSGLDALSHLVEAYTTATSDPFTDVLCIKGIELVTRSLKKAYDDGGDMDARSDLALAANFGGIAFTNQGLHFGHTFAHEIGGVFGVTHGAASAYPIPVMIRFAAKHVPARASAIATAMGVKTTDEAIAAVIELMHYCGVKRFKDIPITVEQLQAIAQDAADHNAFFHNTVVPITVDEFKELIADIVETYDA
jgi:alcohol dehydrogenase class IV